MLMLPMFAGLLFFPVLPPVPEGLPEWAGVLIPWLVGVLNTFLIQEVKHGLGWSGKQAMWLAVWLSAAIGLLLVIVGGAADGSLMVVDGLFFERWASMVAVLFSVATWVYKQFLAEMEPQA